MTDVWMISPLFYPYVAGAQRQAQIVSEMLLARGWSLRVLTRRHSPGLPDDLPAEDVVDGVPVTRLYSRGGRRVRSLLYVLGGLWYLIRHGRSGIYHAHGPGTQAWLAVIARYLLDGRSIIKIRNGSYINNKRYLSRAHRRWLFVIPLRLADRVVVVSRDGEQLTHRLGIPPTRVVRVPNGVDTNLFHPVSREVKLATRKRLGFTDNTTIVLYVGRLSLATKDLDTLMHAWAHLPDDVRAEALLVLVGDGVHREKLMHLINSLGIAESVLMVGRKREIRDYYWAADIFTLPSRDEGLSNALLEAMACGLPVVASSVGGTPDVVEEDQNGLLYEPENYHQLAQKLALMIEMKDHWDKMGELGRQAVTSYAELSVVADQLSRLYSQLNRRQAIGTE